jgi:glycerol-3-phosphate dehydrogenase (NAD(P)+)
LNHLAIVGAGSWGTALAIVLAPRFETVRLWVYEADLAARMAVDRENAVYLPGFRLPGNVEPGADLARVVEGAEIVIGAMPSHTARSLYQRMGPHLDPEALVVSATKGLEEATLARMSQVVREAIPALGNRLAVISGPTFAREVAAGHPTALVIASEDETVAETVQAAFSRPAFRPYTGTDPVGVELGAALKNVIAIGAGIAEGLGLGSNAGAALITRGLAEITRLAVRMGARPETLAGLSGLGDLVLTCTGALSRNHQLGLALAAGRSLGEVAASTRTVAEGVNTTRAAVRLAAREQVEMPITAQMHAVLFEGLAPSEAIARLLERELKREGV